MASNVSLLLDSDSNKNESGTNVMSAIEKKNIIAPIPEELKEEMNMDGDDTTTDND